MVTAMFSETLDNSEYSTLLTPESRSFAQKFMLGYSLTIDFAHGSVHVGYVVDKVALGQVFSEFFCIPLSILIHRGSILRYLMKDEQWARRWQQFRDIVSPHRHKLQHLKLSLSHYTKNAK
jgi:hypothetical protein